MKIAVEGCCHGELDMIYETIQFMEKKENTKVDLLLCCGDFQAVRNEGDMKCMAVPQKYRQMQTFYKYYSGEKKAPILTIFIGGNHEASNYLQELPYGGWVAPNIYYLGYAGVVRYRGVRIGGISGIFKSHDYRKGHYEYPPYSGETIRSAYHVRNIEVFKLKQIKESMDIFMSHDWPRSIYHYGDKKQLLKKKDFFRQEVENNTLGSPAASELLNHLQPSYWFSAHLHVKFAAFMQHQSNVEGQLPKATKFLALDKCLPHRDFLQIVDVEHDPTKPDCLEYDLEWLAILKNCKSLLNVTSQTWNMPENNGLHTKWDFSATTESRKEVLNDLGQDLRIPCNFSATIACYDPNKPQHKRVASHIINPQTTEFCALLGLIDINAKIRQNDEGGDFEATEENDADSTSSLDDPSEYSTDVSVLSSSINPDEITLDEDEVEEDIPVQSVEPSPEDNNDLAVNLSKTHVLSDSMAVSSDDAMDSTNDELDRSESSQTEGEGKFIDKPLKRLSDESGRGIVKIKRRNQAIYTANDEEVE
ncbi:lariat debranching enzyme [Pelobates cultripes]|uniref:Lariat debranching enzyme n=1 Tax=Pelobates cultripes TaxID=61616 RepID=A0AAD1SMX8_PELCU|nr:lariat debranching enzyme [Pelobates cultripes]